MSVGSHLVFISHRGVNIKLRFANCLYYALKKSGIDSFLDMEKLPKGNDVRKDMLDAVGRASIQVPIFTEDFGTSDWCLEELAIMMDSKRKRGAKVIPVYYNVEPEELREENGSFGEHLNTFLQNCSSGDERIRRWKDSLQEASWLEGFRLKTYGGAEGKLIEDLVKKIDDEIVDRLPVDMERKPVGLDVKVQEVVKRLRSEEKTRVRVLLVWGMGGVGKTTLAEAIYRQYRKDFEEHSFVHCGELPVIQIQGRLLKDLLRCDSDMAEDVSRWRSRLADGLKQRRVLIILDDVNTFSQLEDAVNLKKLGPGSRILLTSRNKTAFPHEEDFSAVFGGDIYELQTMGDGESLQLLCLHAFRKLDTNPGFENVAKEVAKACGGLPLSLEVLGRHLSTLKEEKQWREAIEKLADNKFKGISGKLMISYEALDDDEKEMFQDVACFLIGRLEQSAKSFWNVSVKGCETGLQKLKDLCLVKVDEKSKCLTMHDHLRDLGRDISRKSKTRVLNDGDLQQLLTEKRGLDKIRGVATSLSCLEGSDIAEMKSLQLLFLDGTELRGTRNRLKGLNIRWLEWKECPHKTLPKDLVTEFLCVLRLGLKFDTTSWFFSVATQLTKLHELDVSTQYRRSVSRFQNLKRHLEMTIGRYCESQGFGALKSVQVLRFEGLKWITKLPFSSSQSKRLRELNISGCKRLEGLPEDLCSLECLEVLWASGLKLITKLPPSFGQLKRLRQLHISGCERLEGLPEDLGSLECLKVLRARGFETAH